MATNTTNYNFKKPDESDFYSIQDQNNNWDKADAALKNLDTPTFEDYSGSTTVPDAATAIGNIKSKGKLSTILSNVKAAFKGVCLLGQIVNNCVTDNAKLPLSAAQGKALMDLYTVLNTNFTRINSDLGKSYETVIATKDVTNNTVTPICNIWLDPGVYIINASLRLNLPVQTTVEQTLMIGGGADGRGSSALTLPAGTQAFTHTSVIDVTGESSNVVLQARQYAGSTVSVTGWLSITKLK